MSGSPLSPSEGRTAGSGSMPRIEERRRECASGGRKIPARTTSRRSSGVRNAVSRRSVRRARQGATEGSSTHGSISRGPPRMPGSPTRRPPTPPTPRPGPAPLRRFPSARVGMRSAASPPGEWGTERDPRRPATRRPVRRRGKDPPGIRRRSATGWTRAGVPGTGDSGRQPTAFPPVAAFQRVTTPEGSDATPAANRIPSRTARPRTGMLRPGVDHREDERLPFVRGMDMVRDRGIVIDAVPFLENVGEVPETHRHSSRRGRRGTPPRRGRSGPWGTRRAAEAGRGRAPSSAPPCRRRGIRTCTWTSRLP